MTDGSDLTDERGDETDAGVDSGLAAAMSGAAKVIGSLSEANKTGVLGENTATSGSDSHGVEGVTDSTSDDVAGVRGEARAEGAGGYEGHGSYGVHGISRADASTDASGDPAGVKGEATGTGVPCGVVGITSGEDGYGGLFENQNTSSYGATGVRGVTSSSGTYATGVEGEATAFSGEVYGVSGVVTSDDPNSAAVRGLVATSSAEGYGVLSEGPTRSTERLEAGGGVVHEQRGDPGTDELGTGEVMTYNSDGSGTGSAGDLVYAVNDGGSVKTRVIVSKSNAT